MSIGLRIFLGYFLIVGLAAFLVLNVFVQEVKPGVRQAMESTLIDTANVLAELAAHDMADGRIDDGEFAGSLKRLGRRNVDAQIYAVRKLSLDYRVYITDARGIVVFDSAGLAVGQDYSRWNDVYLTLRGRYGARSTRTDPDDEKSTVMHVAAPIYNQGRLVGVLTVAKPNLAIQPFIEKRQQIILQWGWVLMGGAFLIGLAVTIWLIRDLGRLGRYARAVSAGERVPPPHGGGAEIDALGRALESMREKLEGKQYVEQYVHTLTHEMKSPLAAIAGAAELLHEKLPPDVRQRFLDNISQQSARLSALADKMLALAAVEHRQALASSEPVDMRQIFEEIASALEARLNETQVILRLKNEPDGSAAAIIAGDRFLLRQALNNLVENALDFSPPGGVIEVRIERQEESMVLTVCDEGAGIPGYALAHLFERFYSLPRPAGREGMPGSKSTGLGLCFVREVAALHGGTITLGNRDDVEHGAVARMTLPLQDFSGDGDRKGR